MISLFPFVHPIWYAAFVAGNLVLAGIWFMAAKVQQDIGDLLT